MSSSASRDHQIAYVPALITSVAPASDTAATSTAASATSDRAQRPALLAPLQRSSILVLGANVVSPLPLPRHSYREFCQHVSAVVAGGGRVLVPCFSTGVVYEAIEAIAANVAQRPPILLVAPAASASLAHASTSVEWCVG